MASIKVVGLETEYGIVHRGVDDPNPITASSLLINAYLARCEATGRRPATQRVSWDFEDESPALDARGFTPLGARPPEIETHLVNAVLTNGARYYVDHAHPEMSTPECLDARTVVRYDRAGEIVVIESMAAAKELLGGGQELIAYKNNSDGKGNSYGTHENYLMDRNTPFSHIVANATVHFVTRQIFIGAGKVGCEIPGTGVDVVPYQLTQRADFFEEEVGLETTLKRPIINTRDEPHADAQKYRRLHVIVGDANMSEFATWLKVGSTMIVLAMIEDGEFAPELAFRTPVQALRNVSYDLTLAQPLRLADGTSATAIEIQAAIIEAAEKYLERYGTDGAGGPDALKVLEAWRETVETLERNPIELADRIDWIAKKKLLDAYRERDGLGWGDARLRALDLQYHDMRPERSVFNKLKMHTMVDHEAAVAGADNPPDDTRAYFRGECLRRYPDSIVAANWDSMVFDTGEPPLRRVPMMEPTRGTAAHVAELLDGCETVKELLDQLES
jgi:proteasome accessory factor PafA2